MKIRTHRVKNQNFLSQISETTDTVTRMRLAYCSSGKGIPRLQGSMQGGWLETGQHAQDVREELLTWINHGRWCPGQITGTVCRSTVFGPIMRLRLINIVLKILALLPLRITQALGGFCGWLAWALHTSPRKVSDINLALCFADSDPTYRKNLCRHSLIETGKSMAELSWVWSRPKATLQTLIKGITGDEHLVAARNKSGGLIAISPHLGAWELCLLPLSAENQTIAMYRSPRQSYLEPLLINGRTRFDIELAQLTPGGIKTVLKGLKQGRAVGILPDQEPDTNNGAFAPFFGIRANTMTLLSRLARNPDVGMVFMFCERLPRGAGYVVHYLPADDLIRSADRTLATAALNQCVEKCIALCPQQYLWSYKRFRRCEDGSRRNYKA